MNRARDPLYRRHRFPAEVIGYAVWLYFRFPLSLRMVVIDDLSVNRLWCKEQKQGIFGGKLAPR
jgi:transposase-like protein